MTEALATLPLVAHVDLARHAPRLTAINDNLGLLSDVERARAIAIAASAHAGPARAARWTAARTLLRALLLAHGEPLARAEAMHIGPHGKPGLGTALHFSISHAGDHALVALARHPVGVDVETVRVVRMSEPRRAMIAAAGAALALSPVAAKSTGDDTVLVGWTMLEALAKATGDGIGAVLAAVGIWGTGAKAASVEAAAARAVVYARDHGLVVARLQVPAPAMAAWAGRPSDMAALVAPVALSAAHLDALEAAAAARKGG